MVKVMKRAMIAMGLGAMALGGAAASAQDGRYDRDRGGEWNHGRDHDRRQPPGLGDHSRTADRGDWRQWRNYDYNRPERGQRGYDPQRYYRADGYRPVRVTRQTRIYRGSDNRYYCRRNDGTTGLVVGAALGGLLGNSLDRGGSSLAGTLIGAAGGGLLGREIDRGRVSCR